MFHFFRSYGLEYRRRTAIRRAVNRLGGEFHDSRLINRIVDECRERRLVPSHGVETAGVGMKYLWLDVLQFGGLMFSLVGLSMWVDSPADRYPDSEQLQMIGKVALVFGASSLILAIKLRRDRKKLGSGSDQDEVDQLREWDTLYPLGSTINAAFGPERNDWCVEVSYLEDAWRKEGVNSAILPDYFALLRALMDQATGKLGPWP